MNGKTLFEKSFALWVPLVADAFFTFVEAIKQAAALIYVQIPLTFVLLGLSRGLGMDLYSKIFW